MSNNLKYEKPLLDKWKNKYNVYYLNGNYSNCNYHKIDFINAGFTLAETIKQLKKQGYKRKTSPIRMYISNIIKKYGLKAEKYISKAPADITGKISKVVYITRNEVFSHLWLNTKISKNIMVIYKVNTLC